MNRKQVEEMKVSYILNHFKLIGDELFRVDGRTKDNEWKLIKMKNSKTGYTRVGVSVDDRTIPVPYHYIKHILMFKEYPQKSKKVKNKNFEISREMADNIIDKIYFDGDKIFKKLFSGKYKQIFPKVNPSGYRTVSVNGKVYALSRLRWVIENNKPIPKGYQIDHIDGNRCNDDISNLRLVTARKNQQNRTRHRNGNLVGTYFEKSKNKWHSSIRIGSARVFLGYAETELGGNCIYNIACKNLDKFKDKKQ